MIIDLVQTTLDNALYDLGIYSFWQKKEKFKILDEYIVYTQNADNEEFFADDYVDIKAADITIRYYYKSSFLDSKEGRKRIRDVGSIIINALKNAGFEVPYGPFDAGDIEGTGYYATIFECNYWRVADG